MNALAEARQARGGRRGRRGRGARARGIVGGCRYEGGERTISVSGEEGSGVSGGGSGIFSTINRVASDNPNRRLCSKKKHYEISGATAF